MVEKMIKGPQIHPNRVIMLNPMLLLLKLIYYGINIKQGRKGNVNILPLIKPLNNYKK